MGIVFSYGATPNFAGLVRDASLEDGENKFKLFDSASTYQDQGNRFQSD